MNTSISHTVHRPPPANRAAVRPRRWQPYCSLPSATQSPSADLITPPLTVLSSTSSSSSSASSSSFYPSCSPLQVAAPPRDSAKAKYALGLVDITAKVLGEIWSPNVVPPAYRPPSLADAYTDLIHDSTTRYIESVFTSKGITTLQAFPTSLVSPFQTASAAAAASTDLQPPAKPTQNPLNPQVHASHLQAFVKEVLRRSRTSGYILQTALCYLEAIRSQIAELTAQEPSRPLDGPEGCDTVAVNIEPNSTALNRTAPLEGGAPLVQLPDSVFAAVKDLDVGSSNEHGLQIKLNLCPALLCPRRAFLAALILASKFTQDKCYSNRAWAKLSGLPTREISRCERAMGKALDWRLWVGRGAQQPSSVNTIPPPVNQAARVLGRRQSEPSISACNNSPSTSVVENAHPLRPASRKLSRCSTAPASSFTGSCAQPQSSAFDPGSGILVAEHIALQIGSNAAMDGSNVKDKILSDAMLSYSSHNETPPSTPGLSYSPSSTESSSGDRTIQMATFWDDATTPGAQVVNVRTVETDPWPWPTHDSFEAIDAGIPVTPTDKRFSCVPPILLTHTIPPGNQINSGGFAIGKMAPTGTTVMNTMPNVAISHVPPILSEASMIE